MNKRDTQLQNEMRALVSMGSTPVLDPGEESQAQCCGPVEWTEIHQLRTVSRMGRCSVCGAPVAMIRKATA